MTQLLPKNIIIQCIKISRRVIFKFVRGVMVSFIMLKYPEGLFSNLFEGVNFIKDYFIFFKRSIAAIYLHIKYALEIFNFIISFYAEFTKLSDAHSENHAEDCGKIANADLLF
jgi:hypothetical protein